uniref:Protein SYS1 homolog n=1 Tax=Ditylum brightwellii TaxID=49249 RepID=A0A7S4QIC6_9STRA
MSTSPTSATGTTTAIQRNPQSGNTTSLGSRHTIARRHNSNQQDATTTTSSNSNSRPSMPSHQTSNSSSTAPLSSFHPKLIVSQIISLQCFYYAILGFIFQVNHVIFATSITMDRIFTTQYLDVWSATGWIDNSAVLTSSVAGAFLLAIIVEKSKKCLDFSVTLFFIHIICCTFYDGMPKTWDWWIIHLLGMMIMILLGEFLCSRVEMMDIPLLVI